MDDEILGRGLGPAGNFCAPDNLRRSVVPEFYADYLRAFIVEESWEDGPRMVKGSSRWVSHRVERIVSALRGAGVYEVPADPLPVTRLSSPSPPKR